jgi:hypothetical protein
MRSGEVEGEGPDRYPIRGIFVGCWASMAWAVINKTVISNQKRDFDFIVFAPVFD